MIDRVTKIKKHVDENDFGEAEGIKNVTINEPFFTGHFPDNPVMPGVLQVEAMAQLSIFQYLSYKPQKDKDFYFVSIDKVKFRRLVIPGDTLLIKIKVLRESERFNKYSGVITVNGEVSCQGEFMAALQDKKPVQE